MILQKLKKTSTIYGGLLALFAAVGLLASFTLLHETFLVANDANYAPSCNINPLLSCESAMKSEYGESFGIPNPAFGIAAFTALGVLGVLLLAGTSFSKWIWRAAVLAATAGLVFALYLYSVAMFVLGSVCPWCFVTWLVTIGAAWAVVTYTLKANIFTVPKWVKPYATFWRKNPGLVLAIAYAALIFGLLLRFYESLFV